MTPIIFTVQSPVPFLKHWAFAVVSYLFNFIDLHYKFYKLDCISLHLSPDATGPCLSPSEMQTTAATPPPHGSDNSDGAAERRFQEAEERLREAIEDLQRRQRHARGFHHPSCDHPDESCVANAIGNLCQSFLLSYGVRVGIGILLRAFKLVRRQSYSSLLDLKVWFGDCVVWLVHLFA